jgi:hypothetical protein
MALASRRFNPLPVLFLAILAVIAMALLLNLKSPETVAPALTKVIVDPNYSHGDRDHPITAPIVRKCFEQNGEFRIYTIDKGKRYLRVCLIDKVTIGFQIVDIINKQTWEKTAYIKDTLHSIDDLDQYIEWMKYPRYRGLLP